MVDSYALLDAMFHYRVHAFARRYVPPPLALFPPTPSELSACPPPVIKPLQRLSEAVNSKNSKWL